LSGEGSDDKLKRIEHLLSGFDVLSVGK